jgi:hypothetical protein
MGMANSSVKKALMAQGIIILVNYALTYISLLLQKPVSETIRTNVDEATTAAKKGMKTVPTKPPLFL